MPLGIILQHHGGLPFFPFAGAGPSAPRAGATAPRCVLRRLTDRCQQGLRVEQELYRIAQEALQNTIKHAQASTVDLRLERTAEPIILEVRDDGRGFDPAGVFPGHLGLHTMRERVTRLGGTFQVESAPGQGSRIRARIADPADEQSICRSQELRCNNCALVDLATNQALTERLHGLNTLPLGYGSI
jgi:anti-sigma regulatory factor (Ser/Thr protein kinase)